jgi:5-methylthioadenosine/S-adenosylhomocysteine deaminase
MESVSHTEASIATAEASGMVTLIGNCLMDVAGSGVPAGLVTTTDEAMRLVAELHGMTSGDVRYVVSPRFILSCTDALTERAVAYAKEHSLRIHTHANEHPDEVALVRERTGTDYILALRDRGLLGNRTSLAHCVHTPTPEREALANSGTAVLHCPTTNLKLGSGLAPIAEYREMGMPVALGADGAPCNNRLSMLAELRQATLVQATAAGPGRWGVNDALFAATAGGAAALGLEDELGSIAVGKRADLVLVDLDRPPLTPGGDPISRLVFAAESSSIRHVMVGGEWKVREGRLTTMDHPGICRDAEAQLGALLSRAGLAR